MPKSHVTIDLVDENGLVSNLYTSTDPLETAFADPKGQGDRDTGYSQTNMTANIASAIVVLPGERIEVYFAWNSPTATWEALEVNMKIDDSDMLLPYPSFVQIPTPDSAFPTYYVYDPEDEFQIYVANTGTDGVYFTYSGTRVNFNGTLGSYAGLVHSANGTGGGGADDWWNLSEDRDSLYVAPGELAKLYFHESTDIPSTNESGDLLPDGTFHTTV